MKALDDVGAQISVFVIGVGAEIDEGELRAIGRQGAVLSKNPAEVKAAFDKIAEQVEAYTKSFYLFSYCSPARAAEHDVRIEADVKDRGKGSLEYHFNANGFQPNCDPNQRPSFDVSAPQVSQADRERDAAPGGAAIAPPSSPLRSVSGWSRGCSGTADTRSPGR